MASSARSNFVVSNGGFARLHGNHLHFHRPPHHHRPLRRDIRLRLGRADAVPQPRRIRQLRHRVCNRTLTLTGTSLLNDFYPSLADPSSGKLSLNKTGTGRWIFNPSTAARSYSGDTTVSAGTLMTNVDNPLPASGPAKGIALSSLPVRPSNSTMATISTSMH